MILFEKRTAFHFINMVCTRQGIKKFELAIKSGFFLNFTDSCLHLPFSLFYFTFWQIEVRKAINPQIGIFIFALHQATGRL